MVMKEKYFGDTKNLVGKTATILAIKVIQDLKKHSRVLGDTIAVCMAAITFAISSTATAAEVTKMISVSAFAEKSADPDMIVLNIDVWSKGATAKEAQSLNAEMTVKVQKIIEKFAIKKEDVVTQHFNVNPENFYDQKTGQSRIVGFNTTHGMMLTHRKIAESGQLLDAISSIERNKNISVNLNGVSWDYSKRNQLEVESLANAVKNTRVRAEELAKAAGVKIKNVLSLSHSSGGGGGFVRPMFRSKSMMMADMAGSSAAPETSLSSGQIKVHVDVQAEYEIQ